MSKKIIIMIVGMVLVLALGIGGYVYFSKDKGNENEKENEQKEEVKEEIDYEKAKKTEILIEEDTYSLSRQGEYAKLGISIRVKSEEEAKKVNYHLSEIKADIVKEFSKLTTDDLRGAEGFDFTEKKIEGVVKKYIEKEKINSISVISLKLQN